jgi:hypothetical protein
MIIVNDSAVLPKEAVMFEMMKFDMFVNFLKMDHKPHIADTIGPRIVMATISLMDRILPAIGESLIRVGNKLKQRSHARLTAEHAQTPTFMIML